jgi:hypothetical protein
MNLWSTLRRSNPVSNQAVQSPQDDFALLNNAQIIEKLAALPWLETRTGVPGIAIAGLDGVQKKLLADSRTCHLVSLMDRSSAFAGEGYYTYTPALVDKIARKTGFKKEGGDSRLKEATRAFLVNTVPKLAEIMDQYGEKIFDRTTGALEMIAVSDPKQSEVIIRHAVNPPANSKLYLDCSIMTSGFDAFDADSSSKKTSTAEELDQCGWHFHVSKCNLGAAILGELYLRERGQQQGQPVSK